MHSAMSGRDTANHSFSCNFTRSHGGLPSITSKPPFQPVVLVGGALAFLGHGEDFGEGEVPVEELVSVAQALDFLAHPRGAVVRVALDFAQHVVGDGVRAASRGLFPDEGGAPGVGEEAAVEVAGGADEFGVALLFAMERGGGVVAHGARLRAWRRGGCRGAHGAVVGAVEEGESGRRSSLLRFLASRQMSWSSPSRGLKASSGMPSARSARGGAEEAVADTDVVVEEGERLAGLEGLHPEADLAQLDGHRVDVDAVEAAADDVAQGVRGWPRASGSSSPVRTAARRRAMRWAAAMRKWPRADSRVADLEGEEGLARRSTPCLAAHGLSHDRIERGVEQALDERVGRVVAAGGLALVAGSGLKLEGAGVGVDVGVQLQQALVDAAELLGAEVAVVHGAADVAILDKCERMDGGEEMAIRDEAVRQIRRGARGLPQEAAERRKVECGAVRIGTELSGDELEDGPEVGMRRARAVEREPRRRVME